QISSPLVVDILRVCAHQFERAYHAGCARQLIEREQAQRVAHDDSDARAEDTWADESAMCYHEGCEAEISLGLAAAGREEQEIGNFGIGVLAIGKTSDVEQDEGELERPPCRRRLCRGIAGCAGVAATRCPCDGQIHVAESTAGNVIARQELNAIE